MKKILVFLSTFIFILLISPLTVHAETFTEQYQWTMTNTDSNVSFSLPGLFTDKGNGVLTTNITVQYKLTENQLTGIYPANVPMISQVIFSSYTNSYTCNIGNTSVFYALSDNNNNTQQITSVTSNYTITCNMNMSSYGLTYAFVSFLPTNTHYYTVSRIDFGPYYSFTTSDGSTINNSINNVNDSINNDNVSTNTENSSTASSWASNNASDSVVSDMVLMPITLLNAFSNGFNGTCSPYNLGSLFGTNLVLPCINISNYLGATLWGIIDVLMSGFLIYGIGKKFVRVFNDFTNLKDSQVDELYGGGNQ